MSGRCLGRDNGCDNDVVYYCETEPQKYLFICEQHTGYFHLTYTGNFELKPYMISIEDSEKDAFSEAMKMVWKVYYGESRIMALRNQQALISLRQQLSESKSDHQSNKIRQKIKKTTQKFQQKAGRFSEQYKQVVELFFMFIHRKGIPQVEQSIKIVQKIIKMKKKGAKQIILPELVRKLINCQIYLPGYDIETIDSYYKLYSDAYALVYDYTKGRIEKSPYFKESKIQEIKSAPYGIDKLGDYETKKLIEIVRLSSKSSEDEENYSVLNSNALTLLCHIGTGLRGTDLSNLLLQDADLTRASLVGVNFENTHFVRSVLANCTLMNSNFKGCKFDQVNFGMHRVIEDRSGINTFVFTTDGQNIIIGSEDGFVKQLNIHARNKMKRLFNHQLAVRHLELTPKNDKIVSIGKDKFFKIYNNDTQKVTVSHKIHGKPLCLAINEKGNFAAIGCKNSKIYYIGTKSGKIRKVFETDYEESSDEECQEYEDDEIPESTKQKDIENEKKMINRLKGRRERKAERIKRQEAEKKQRKKSEMDRLKNENNFESIVDTRGHYGKITCIKFYQKNIISAGSDLRIICWDINEGRILKIFVNSKLDQKTRDQLICEERLLTKQIDKELETKQKEKTKKRKEEQKRMKEEQRKEREERRKKRAESKGKEYKPKDYSKEDELDKRINGEDEDEDEEQRNKEEDKSDDEEDKDKDEEKPEDEENKNKEEEKSDDEENEEKLFNQETENQGPDTKAHESDITSLAIHNGKLISGSKDTCILVWSLKKAKLLYSLQGHTLKINSLDAHSNMLASASGDSNILIWSMESKNQLCSIQGHASEIKKIAYSPDGNYLASCSGDGFLKLWTPVFHEDPLEKHSTMMTSCAFSGDNKYVTTSNGKGEILLWSMKRGSLVRKMIAHSKPVICIKYSEDGRFILSASHDGSIAVWDALEGYLLSYKKAHPKYLVTTVCAKIDFSLFASCGSDGLVKVWKFVTEEVDGKLNYRIEDFKEFDDHNSKVTAICFSEEKPIIASAGKNRDLIVYDFKAERLHEQVVFKEETAHSTLISGLKYQQYLLYSCSYDCLVKVWKEDLCILAIKLHPTPINCFEILQNGKLLIGGADNSLCLVSYDSSELEGKNVEEIKTLKSLNKRMEEKEVKETVVVGNIEFSFEYNSMPVASLAVSNDQSLVAITSWNNTVKVCKIDNLQQGNSEIEMVSHAGLYGVGIQLNNHGKYSKKQQNYSDLLFHLQDFYP